MTYAPRPATAPTRMPDLTAGLCRTRPDLPWHPDGHTPAGLLREALNLCCGCPVMGDCLDWGLDANEQGIWGGTTDLMRQQIRHNRRRTGNMSDDLTRWLDARAALKAQQAEIADRLTAVDDQIRALLGDHTEAAAGRWRVTYRWVDSTRVDTRKVKEILPPELLSAVQTTSSARVLRVTEAPQ